MDGSYNLVHALSCNTMQRSCSCQWSPMDRAHLQGGHAAWMANMKHSRWLSAYRQWACWLQFLPRAGRHHRLRLQR